MLVPFHKILILEFQSFILGGSEVLISTQLGQPQCLYDHRCGPATIPLFHMDSQLPEAHPSLYLQNVTPQSISVTSGFPYPLTLPDSPLSQHARLPRSASFSYYRVFDLMPLFPGAFSYRAL